MTIAFYNPISAPFHNSTRAASNFNEMVGFGKPQTVFRQRKEKFSFAKKILF